MCERPDKKKSLTLDCAKAIYRAAVDPKASDAEGDAWWGAVHVEMIQVLAARTLPEAAQIIAWWHYDWSMVGDSAKAAAQRIRAAARAAAH